MEEILVAGPRYAAELVAWSLAMSILPMRDPRFDSTAKDGYTHLCMRNLLCTVLQVHRTNFNCVPLHLSPHSAR